MQKTTVRVTTDTGSDLAARKVKKLRRPLKARDACTSEI